MITVNPLLLLSQACGNTVNYNVGYTLQTSPCTWLTLKFDYPLYIYYMDKLAI